MEFGRFLMTPSLVAAGVAATSLVGVLLWWLVRKRQKRVWLPTIRIMRLESHVLPKLSILSPPWLPFICFSVVALVMALFSLRPTTQVFTPFEPNQTRIHIFIDLSPSVSAHVDLEDYSSRLATLYDGLREAGRVTLSTSHGSGIFEPKSTEEVVAYIKKYDFHRAGLRLGTALKILLEDLGQVDRLFIVSDRDQHSWAGFNWQYLLDEMAVNWVDVSGKATTSGAQNVFIHGAKFLSSPSSTTMEWDVEISRHQSETLLEGQLVARYKGRDLAKNPWKMVPGKSRQVVRMEWSESLLNESEGGASRDVPLVFEVTTEGERDLLTLDNVYRSEVRGMKHDLVLIGETRGEQLLEDPLHQLQVSMELMGFKIKRYDFIKQPGPKWSPQEFMILAGGTGHGVDRFCPKNVESVRHTAAAQGGNPETRAWKSTNKAGPRVWLLPISIDGDYRELCHCYARLAWTQGPQSGEPEFCQHVTARSQWIGLLKSLGAKQLGGSVGEAHEALAFQHTDPASGTQVIAFTVPLVPLKASGITHAALPILIKDMLVWQGLLENQGKSQSNAWPRLDDVAQSLWSLPKDQDPETVSRLRQSNVPVGESFLSEADLQILPPRWTAQMDWNVKQLPTKKDHEDPLPWIKLAGWVIVAMAFIEACFGLGRRLIRIMGRRPEVVVLLLICLLSAPAAVARVEFSVVGYGSQDFSMATLSREVSQRTSIELTTKPLAYPKLAGEALGEPWLWVRDKSLIVSAAGKLLPQVAIWLKRGGFLIIESGTPAAQLAKLTEDLMGKDARWLPLPPDHELMRSFYLLDALPDCNGEIWRGFSFDGRLAILSVPYGFLETLLDKPTPSSCAHTPDGERSVRLFVNLTMVALATDYKKDQIHLPEILKRLR